VLSPDSYESQVLIETSGKFITASKKNVAGEEKMAKNCQVITPDRAQIGFEYDEERGNRRGLEAKTPRGQTSEP
jgi:hypothetical protein